jgi:hypothetical protein
MSEKKLSAGKVSTAFSLESTVKGNVYFHSFSKRVARIIVCT